MGIKPIKNNRGIVGVDNKELKANTHVYCDGVVGDGVGAWSATLNQTNIRSNNNKFYILQLLVGNTSDYYIHTRYGRVGVNGVSGTIKYSDLAAAQTEFKRVFKNKTRNAWGVGVREKFKQHTGKYYLCELELTAANGDPGEVEEEQNATSFEKPSVLSEEPESTLHPRHQSLIKMMMDVKEINNVLEEFDIDTKRLPLGKISSRQLDSAQSVLNEIALCIKQNTLSIKDGGRVDEFTTLSSKFYTLVPYASGRNAPPIIDTNTNIKKWTDVIETLRDIEVIGNIVSARTVGGNPIDQAYNSLGVRVSYIPSNSRTYRLLDKCVRSTHAPTHTGYRLELIDAFNVRDRKREKTYGAIVEEMIAGGVTANKRLLWHGSRVCNFASILKNNLRMPNRNQVYNGTMFNFGIYFADSVSKSANYCGVSGGGRGEAGIGILALCEVALGNALPLTRANPYVELDADHHSVWGQGAMKVDEDGCKHTRKGVIVPSGDLIKSGVDGDLRYNEYIVYRVEQQIIRYLLVVKFNNT